MKAMQNRRRPRDGARPKDTAVSCRVCGSADLALDEVSDAGMLMLGECGRCHHRWTERVLLRSALARDEVAEAA